MFGSFRTTLVLCLACFFGVHSASAQDAYKLSSGDSLNVSFPGETTPIEVFVDFDGDIRLPGIGGLSVADLTLDETQLRVEQTLSDAKLFVDPTVSVSIARYAPIVVGGMVNQPGQYPYLPQMTVATALGLSGGVSTINQDQLSTVRLLTETQSRIQRLKLDVASAVVRLAAYQAFLEGQAVIELTGQDREKLGDIAASELASLIDSEESYLAATFARSSELNQIWAKEIEDLEAQSALSSQRLALQRTIMQSAEEELTAARALQESGLQTSARFAAILQRSTDEKARVLEIETAKISIDRAIAESNRQRFAFNSALRLDFIRESRELQLALETAELDLDREQEHLSNLADLDVVSDLGITNVTTTFAIIGPRAERFLTEEVSLQSRLLPSDTLVVTVEIE